MDYRKTITTEEAHFCRILSLSGSLTMTPPTSSQGQLPLPPPPPPPPPLSNKAVSMYKKSIYLSIISLPVAIIFFSGLEIMVVASNCLFAFLILWTGIQTAKKGEPSVTTPHYGPYSHWVGTQTDGRYVYNVMETEQNHYFAGTHITFARFSGVLYSIFVAFWFIFSVFIAASYNNPAMLPAMIMLVSGVVALAGASADPLARAYKTNFWGRESFSDSASDAARAHARLIELGWLKEETPEPAHTEEASKVRCQFCGELLEETDRKCPNCGAPA